MRLLHPLWRRAGAVFATGFPLALGAPVGAQSPPDSAVVVALVRHAVAHLPPRDSALRSAPWRVEASDSASRAWRSAAAAVAAAIKARAASRRDSIQAVMTLGEYADSGGVHHLSVEIVTLGRCGATWERAWAYTTWYEVLGREVSGAWEFMPPREVGHGDPTVCLERPDLNPDGAAARPITERTPRRGT